MKKYTIFKKDKSVGYVGIEQDPVAMIQSIGEQGFCGKPERWVPAQEGIDPADVLESEMREVVPAIPAQLDEQGNEIAPEVPAVMQEFVKLRAEYTVEIEDITQEHALAECLAKRKAEYPSPEDFLNAYFDGGDPAVQLLNAKRQEIKAKYPKPGA